MNVTYLKKVATSGIFLMGWINCWSDDSQKLSYENELMKSWVSFSFCPLHFCLSACVSSLFFCCQRWVCSNPIPTIFATFFTSKLRHVLETVLIWSNQSKTVTSFVRHWSGMLTSRDLLSSIRLWFRRWSFSSVRNWHSNFKPRFVFKQWKRDQ